MATLRSIIARRPWVSDISDERTSGNSIIIGLEYAYDFADDPGCGTCGFDTWDAAEAGTRKNRIIPHIDTTTKEEK